MNVNPSNARPTEKTQRPTKPYKPGEIPNTRPSDELPNVSPTTFKTLAELKEIDPELYQRMLQDIAATSQAEARKLEARIKKSIKGH